jgi:hypothetical protein
MIQGKASIIGRGDNKNFQPNEQSLLEKAHTLLSDKYLQYQFLQ